MPPKADPRKYCAHCGVRMRRKRYNGRLEDLGVFNRRKYCDKRCMAADHADREVGKQGHLWRARRHRKDACERCGSSENLHVHHRDDNWRNDDIANLETLCGSCHLEHHWATGDRRDRAAGTRRVPVEGLQELEGFADDVADRLTAADRERLFGIIDTLRNVSP